MYYLETASSRHPLFLLQVHTPHVVATHLQSNARGGTCPVLLERPMGKEDGNVG